MTKVVIWAQSVCRSTMDLYREVKKLRDDIGVTVVLRRDERGEVVRKLREAQGQGDYSDVVDCVWDGEFNSGIEFLEAGAIHVFSGYQASRAVRELMVEAKRRGKRVVEYDEAPCEMCLGFKAWLKRLYYRFVLPKKVQKAVSAADLFISASGNMGMDRLVRLGWKREAIVPFGYACGRLGKRDEGTGKREECGVLRVLHTGIEAKYRGVDVLKRVATSLKRRGVELEVKFTGGKVDASELSGLYEWADIVVACGICEPWGMRVNDVLLEGLPVVISDGMGVAMLCDEFGCGCVVPKGDASALAAVLERCARDREFLAHLRSGAKMAAEEIAPGKRAKVWLNKVLGE
jgi:glycosyltransferase involved in cell wall biosynthesis